MIVFGKYVKFEQYSLINIVPFYKQHKGVNNNKLCLPKTRFCAGPQKPAAMGRSTLRYAPSTFAWTGTVGKIHRPSHDQGRRCKGTLYFSFFGALLVSYTSIIPQAPPSHGHPFQNSYRYNLRDPAPRLHRRCLDYNQNTRLFGPLAHAQRFFLRKCPDSSPHQTLPRWFDASCSYCTRWYHHHGEIHPHCSSGLARCMLRCRVLAEDVTGAGLSLDVAHLSIRLTSPASRFPSFFGDTDI